MSLPIIAAAWPWPVIADQTKMTMRVTFTPATGFPVLREVTLPKTEGYYFPRGAYLYPLRPVPPTNFAQINIGYLDAVRLLIDNAFGSSKPYSEMTVALTSDGRARLTFAGLAGWTCTLESLADWVLLKCLGFSGAAVTRPATAGLIEFTGDGFAQNYWSPDVPIAGLDVEVSRRAEVQFTIDNTPVADSWPGRRVTTRRFRFVPDYRTLVELERPENWNSALERFYIDRSAPTTLVLWPDRTIVGTYENCVLTEASASTFRPKRYSPALSLYEFDLTTVSDTRS